MKVLVNGKEITLFRRAKVKDVLLSLDEKILHNISNYEILDAYGNETDTDGALQDGTKLFVREKRKTNL